MTIHEYRGGCHCGNITLVFASARPPEKFRPGACDCGFCRKHAASYVSDPQGRLQVSVRDAGELSAYRQGSESAEFLVCRRCGVVVAVTYREQGHLYATVNAQVLEPAGFGSAAAVSPKNLDPAERRALWKKVWIPDVSIQGCPAA